MTLQDYREELKNDLLEFAEESKGYVNDLEKFRDNAFVEDTVTGNGSGSYTFNSKQAEENIKDLIFSDELLRMFQDFGYDHVPFEKGPEYIDVSIRCFLVDEVINENEEEIKEILEIE
jgi:hypothetical protein